MKKPVLLPPLLTLLALPACLPAAHDVVGTSCSQGSDCGAASLYCVEGACSSTAPPARRDGGLPAGVVILEDFESGAAGWQGITANSKFTVAATRWHSPSHSAQLNPTGSATSDPLGIDYALPKPYDTQNAYCASAWINSNSISTYLNLTFRVYAGAAQYNQGTVAVPLDGGVWQEVFSGPMRLDGGENEADVRVVTNNYKVGENFFTDDIEVWVSDGGCGPSSRP